jgi:hypothetical protein
VVHLEVVIMLVNELVGCRDEYGEEQGMVDTDVMGFNQLLSHAGATGSSHQDVIEVVVQGGNLNARASHNSISRDLIRLVTTGT